MNLIPPDHFFGQRFRPAVAASIVFLMAAVAAAGLIWRLQKHRLQEYRLHVANVAADHAGQLQRSLDHGFSATYTLAVLVRQGKGTISDFDTVAKRMLPLYPTVSAMQLAPGGVIRQIVPLAGNEEAIGHDILNDPKRANEGRLARDSGKLTLAGPFVLKQGGVGAVARLPVNLEDEQGNSYFWGFTNVLVRFPQALEQSQLAELARRGFGYELWRIDPDNGKKQRISASTEAALHGAVDQRIVVPNGTWTLSVAPLSGWGNPVQMALDAGLGLLFSLLLAWLAKLLVESKTHEMELESLVDIRTSEIRESKDRLRMLEDNLPDSYLYQLLYEDDRQHRFIYLSAGVENVHGLSRDDILQDAGYILRQIEPEQLSAMAAAEAVSRQSMSDFEMEIRIRRLDNECRWLQLRSRPSRRPDGEVVWDGMAVDITGRREAEAALRDERDFSDTLLNSLPGVFYLYDEDLHFLRWNRNFERVLGYSYEEIAGLSPLDLFADDDKKLVAERIQRVFDQGESEVEAGFVSKDGTKTPYYFTGRRTLIGDRVCLLGVGFDISERKRLEAQLLHSQKMDAIGQLAGGVAHDFNNILQVIMGYSNVLLMRGSLVEKQREAVEQIAASTEKASQLTRGLLAFSRKQVVDLRMANLNDIVQRVQKLLVRIIGEDIRLKIIINDSLLPVRADSSQIEQILMNLATNARDAMSKGGVLTIETGLQVIDEPFEHAHGYGKPGRYALVSVSDTGSGMEEETRSKLFEPFYTRKEVGKGTGLGMSIVYGLVKQHNGYINVYSEVGHGTVVRIYIPLVEIEKVEFPERADKIIPKGGDETILLVEDDAGVRKLISSVLTEFGYDLIEAEDGVEAVETFGKHREKIRLILMDLIMPRKNGMEAYKEICRIQSGIKVLYLSGYTSDFIQSRGVVEEGIELIMKPVQPTELLLKVREMLDGSAGVPGRRESPQT